MNQKQSEDFDSRVRKLAEEAESAYQAHSWTLMEKLLNDKKNKKRFAIWYWPLGAIGFLALIWFGYSYFITSRQENIENQLPIPLRTNINPEQTYLYALTITADRVFDLNEVSLSTSNKSVAQGLNNNPVSILNSHKLKDVKQVTSNLVSRNKTRNLIVSNVNADRAEREKDKNNFSVLHPDLIDHPGETNPSRHELINQSIEKDITLSRVDHAERIFNLAALSSPDLILNDNRKINLKDWPEEELSNKQAKQSSSALILNVGWAPEYTAVVKRSVGNLGNTYGLNVGYRLNRWTISAGLQKSSKDYNAKKEDYLIEENSYYKNLTFINIGGNCNILQLPVTLGYNIVSSKQFILQLNASVSSLRMDKEKYVYDYFHTNWKPGHDLHDYAYKNWHWLASASAGISIQKSFAKNWNVSLSPYYQLPLKGIGEGKVHLQSFGSQVGVLWNIPLIK